MKPEISVILHIIFLTDFLLLLQQPSFIIDKLRCTVETALAVSQGLNVVKLNVVKLVYTGERGVSVIRPAEDQCGLNELGTM